MEKNQSFKTIKLQNSKINNISTERDLVCHCPIGDDDYKANVKINIQPNKYVPEYISMTTYLDNLNGRDLTIEKLADTIYNAFKRELEPDTVSIIVDAISPSHAQVKVAIYE